MCNTIRAEEGDHDTSSRTNRLTSPGLTGSGRSSEGVLHDRGRLPSALGHWDHAPALVKNLIARGKIPANISQADLLEAACRT